MSFKVEKNDKVGRYAVATKDLEPGEIFFEEFPAAVGPKSYSPLICLGCYTPVDGNILCPECSWPVCSLDCSKNELHATAECVVFSSAKVKFQPAEDPTVPTPQYECITPLRVLLAKEKYPERWDQEVSVMEAHNNKRKELPEWNSEKINVVNFLLDKCNLKNRFTEELIHFACGILEVNSFEVRCDNGFTIRGLYPKLAILSHNCVVNTIHSIVPVENYRLFARSTVQIKKDQELFCSYTYNIAPTLRRRENLIISKYFDCTCDRCADQKELNSHMSSLKCTKCDNGLILSSSPLDSLADWQCTHCDFKLSGDQVKRIYKVIETEIENVQTLPSIDETIETIEKTLRKYKSVLHPNHAYNIALKHNLVQLYGRAAGYTFEDLPDILLERKIDLCKQVLNVLDIIEPGYTRIRGLVLYELHVPLMLFNRSRFEYGELDKEGFCMKMEEVVKILEEASKILCLEPKNTLEGAIGSTGQTSLEQLKMSIESLKTEK